MQTQRDPKICLEEAHTQPPAATVPQTRLAPCLGRLAPGVATTLLVPAEGRDGGGEQTCLLSPKNGSLFHFCFEERHILHAKPRRGPRSSQRQPPTTVCVVPQNRKDWRRGSDHRAKGPGPSSVLPSSPGGCWPWPLPQGCCFSKPGSPPS